MAKEESNSKEVEFRQLLIIFFTINFGCIRKLKSFFTQNSAHSAVIFTIEAAEALSIYFGSCAALAISKFVFEIVTICLRFAFCFCFQVR